MANPQPSPDIIGLVLDTTYRLFLTWAEAKGPDLDIAEYEKMARKAFSVSLNYYDTVRESVPTIDANVRKFGNLQGRISVEKGF